MDVTPIDVGDATGELPDQPIVYRVRAWTAPAEPGFAWMVDEWDVRNAESVTSVLDWAETHVGGAPFEIFVQWTDHASSKDGNLVPRRRFTRIFGEPADDGGMTETITFHGAD